MGLIQAAIGAVGGVLADQWKEFFICEAMDENVLAVKGEKRTDRRGANRRGSDNVISNGSGIVVADGQCMIIVDQGRVVEFCAQPGQFTWNASSEPSLFTGSLSQSLAQTFSQIGQRFAFGGQAGKDQRVYYFNLKEIVGNKFGTPNPVPFRVVDRNIGLDVDISIRCNGEYSYKIVDPMLFYANVCGNVEESYTRDRLDSMLRAELMTALQPAFASISEMGIRYSALPGHTLEISEALNAVLSKKWTQTRGIAVASFAVNSVNASPEDEQMIKQLQKSAVMRDPTMAAANLVGAQADAMRAAASNSAGAMNGFIGMNMAGNAGGFNAQNLYAMGQQAAPAANTWKCACGTENTGKFCSACGAPKPEKGWKCDCGQVNLGKFCSACGKPKPAGAPLYRCDKCGWQPEDPAHPPKFCPECGDPFDDADRR